MLSRHTYVVTILILLCTPGITLSQIKKGDEYYNRAEYIKAIVYYKKEVSKRKTTTFKKEALVKLGNSYRFINNYAEAEDSYRKAIEEDGEIAPQVYYDYAQVLKTNGKYEEAAEQFANYIKLAPNDENAKKAQKFCKEIKYYLTLPAEYTTKNIGAINTDKAEFSPFVMNKKLMFVAERESFDFVNYEVNDYDGQPFLNMYVSNLEGVEVKKSKTLSSKINSEFHDGPACMSSDGKTLYFTRVVNSGKKGSVNHSKIFSARGSERKWHDVKPISINSNDYSIAHPCLSPNDSVLYFTSNMPGGFGGKDLYMSTRTADGWSEPVNLGPDINTSGDEMFPSIRKDGVLFFSSNGLPGFGGLDIYSAKKIDQKWILQRNEGTDLNSSTDDFGITFLDDSTGYFSSNRAGGKGNDDIYLYRYINRSQTVEGTVLLTENKRDFAKKKKVILVDEKGVPVDSMLTDEKGRFVFKHLGAGSKYMAVVAEDDPGFAGKAHYYMADKDSVIQRVSHRLPNGRYAFKNLPVEPNTLPELYTDDNLVFAGTLTSGDKNLGGVKMKLVNEKGQVLEEVVTDEKGAFVFKNIPLDQNYIVSVEEDDIKLEEGSKITLTSKAGKEIKSFYKSKEAFTFKVLSSDKSVLTEMKEEEIVPVLAGTLKSGDKILSNVKMKIVDESGKVLEEVTTDAKGNFVFKNIPPNSNYIVALDENDVKLEEGQKVSMVNKSGKELKSFYKSKEEFAFKILSTDKNILSTMAVEEEAPVFAGSLKSGDKALGNVRVKMVNELGEVIEEATTDEKGNFVFRNIPSNKNYILAIEEKDVELTEGSKITLASQSGKEIKSFYKNKEEFSFKVLSTDKKVIDEMFVEDVDLVMEIFGYIYNQDKKPIPNARVTVKDEDGSNERHLVTNEAGKFRFKNLREEKNYIIEADASDPSLAGVSRIYIADSKARIYKVVELIQGKFAFKMLEMDKKALGEFLIDEPSMKLAEQKKLEKRNEEKKTGQLATNTNTTTITKKDKPDKGTVTKKDEVVKTDPVKEEKTPEPEVDMTITIIENIYYEYGDYRIVGEAEKVMNKAVEILTENPRLIMEISSHTDSQSSASFNLGLSRRRAQAAVDYLVAKGIARTRLSAVGYGETRLINHCADNVPCGEEDHKVNRRTEFKISRKPVKK